MIIRKIILENIRSYEELSLELPNGSILLAGDIGTGKTTILLAIEFALFGLQPGQRGNSLLRHGAEEGKVTLDIEVENSQISISRTLKRTSKTVSQEDSSITIDGKIEELSVSELKNKVLAILDYPGEFAKKTNLLYRFTVYTPQEEMKQIILEDTETRLNTLRHIFGIDKYKQIKENTILATTKLREEMRMKEGQILSLEDLKNNLADRKSSIEKLRETKVSSEAVFQKNKEERKKIEQEMSDLEKKKDEKKKFEQEIEKTNILITGKNELCLSLSKEEHNIEKEILELKKHQFSRDKLIAFEKEREELKIKIEELQKIYTESLGSLKHLDSKIKEVESTRDKFSGLTYCPTCLQNVSHVHKANVLHTCEDEMQKCISEKKSVENEKNRIISEISSAKSSFVKVEKDVSELKILSVRLEQLIEKENRINIIKKQQAEVKKDMDFLEKHRASLKDSVRDFLKYDSLFQQKEKEFRDALKKERESEILLAQIIKEIDITNNLILKFEQDILEKEKIKKQLAILAEIQNWLSTAFLEIVSLTERQIMLRLKDEFSNLLNEWFTALVPETLTARLDENFNPVIEQQEFELDYSYLSGGERTAVALAYRLALNQVVNTLLSKIKTRDIIILDEPTDGFSEQQLDKMRDVLQQLYAKQIIIVSHEQKIESFVEHVIKIRKDDRKSRAE